MTSVLALVRRLTVDGREASRDAFESVRRVRLAVQEHPSIPALKALLARRTGEARWRNVRPPLETLVESQEAALAEYVLQT